MIQRNGEAEPLTKDHRPDREDEAVSTRALRLLPRVATIGIINAAAWWEGWRAPGRLAAVAAPGAPEPAGPEHAYHTCTRIPVASTRLTGLAMGHMTELRTGASRGQDRSGDNMCQASGASLPGVCA